MKLTGTATMRADRSTVWSALNDPAVLVRTIPGCRRLEALGDDAFAMTISAGVGSITGVYDGRVALSDQQQPGSFRLRAQGSGAPGTIGADVSVTLVEDGDGGTALRYDADAVVGGAIGGVGQRMLAGVSKRMAAQFFANVDAVLSESATAVQDGASSLPTDAAATGPSGLPRSSVGLPPGPATAAATPSVSAAARPVHPSTTGAPAGTVFTAPGEDARARGLVTASGVALGALAALAGVLVGGWMGRRRR